MMNRGSKTAKSGVPSFDLEQEIDKSRVIQILAELEAAYQSLSHAGSDLMTLKGYDYTKDIEDLARAKAIIRQVQGGSVYLLGLFKKWVEEDGE